MLVSRSVLFPAMMLLGLLGSVQATVVKTQASQVMKGLASKTASGIQDHFKSSEATSGHSRHLLAVSNDFSKQAGRSLLQMAPDKSCCVASYGDSTTDNCKHCAELPNFVCRPSHQQDGVSDTSTDCISFAYADEATCLAADGAQVWLTSSDNDGNGCPATTTSFPAWACTATCGDSAAYSVTVRTNPDAFPQFPRHAWPAKARFSCFHRRHARNAGGAAVTPTVT